MKKVILIVISVLMTELMLTSCSRYTNESGTSNEIPIGEQVWMKENLVVDKFRNGDTIMHAKTDEEWRKAADNGVPAWCYFDNNPANEVKYGKLYNWFAVNDPRGLAPVGLHIPTDTEWTALINFLGGTQAAGDKMKAKEGWNGTNTSGFSGLPGGDRYALGSFSPSGNYGIWWSSTEYSTSIAWARVLYYNDVSVGRNDYNKGYGLSVRCLRDK